MTLEKSEYYGNYIIKFFPPWAIGLQGNHTCKGSKIVGLTANFIDFLHLLKFKEMK